jgi:hypothetical protein
MFTKMSKIAAAVAGVCAMGVSIPAQAFVYATSALDVENLQLNIIGTTTVVNSYQFSLSNTASLNSAPVVSGAVCNSLGLPCSPISPVLDAAPANAPGSTLNRTNNNFTFFGTNQVDSYSGADSVIRTSQLVQPATPTSVQQIAESLLNINGFADANSLIQSTTSLTQTFTIGAGSLLSLSFLADPDQSAEINGATGTYITQSNLNSSFTLTGAGGSINWTPNGTAASDCTVTGFVGVTCTETADSQDLNFNTTTSINPGLSTNSFEAGLALTPFGINISGLADGTYTIAFNTTTSTLITRQVVPEPGVLGLVGAALTGLGVVGVRRRRTK